MAGVKIVHVSFKNQPIAIAALMSGEVQVAVYDAAAVLPHAKTGKLRTLAVTTAEPSALTPGLPTVAASGLPGYETSPPNSTTHRYTSSSAAIARSCPFISQHHSRRQEWRAGFTRGIRRFRRTGSRTRLPRFQNPPLVVGGINDNHERAGSPDQRGGQAGSRQDGLKCWILPININPGMKWR